MASWPASRGPPLELLALLALLEEADDALDADDAVDDDDEDVLVLGRGAAGPAPCGIGGIDGASAGTKREEPASVRFAFAFPPSSSSSSDPHATARPMKMIAAANMPALRAPIAAG